MKPPVVEKEWKDVNTIVIFPPDTFLINLELREPVQLELEDYRYINCSGCLFSLSGREGDVLFHIEAPNEKPLVCKLFRKGEMRQLICDNETEPEWDDTQE